MRNINVFFLPTWWKNLRQHFVNRKIDKQTVVEANVPWSMWSRPGSVTVTVDWQIGIERRMATGRILETRLLYSIDPTDSYERLSQEGNAISEAARWNIALTK